MDSSTKWNAQSEKKSVTIRIKTQLLDQIDELARTTNRSRSAVVVLVLARAMEVVRIKD